MKLKQVNKYIKKIFLLLAFVVLLTIGQTYNGDSLLNLDVKASCNSFACCSLRNHHCGATCRDDKGWHSSCLAGTGAYCVKKTSDYCNWNGSTCVWENSPLCQNGVCCSNNTTCYQCKCTANENDCDLPDGNEPSACREKTTETSCSYYTCPSSTACSATKKTKKGVDAESSPPECEFNIPSKIRYSGIKEGTYSASVYDRGDLLRINAFSYDVSACGRILYKNIQDTPFPQRIPFVYRDMDCSDSGYNRERTYTDAIIFKPFGGSAVANYLDSNNTCKVKVISEVKSEGPVGESFIAQCSQSFDVYYPPTYALDVRIKDKNKQSASGVDGKYPPKMVEDRIVDWVGGLGENPFQIIKGIDPNAFASDGICSVTSDPDNFVYRVGDNNPFVVEADFWDENGLNDFDIVKQDIYLVNESTGQEYPINRDTPSVPANILGLYNVSVADNGHAPDTRGFTKYKINQNDPIETWKQCLLDSKNIYCVHREKIDIIPSSQIKKMLGNLKKTDSAYGALNGLPSNISKNPPEGRTVNMKVYQKNLLEGKYFVRVKTHDNEGASVTENFKNVNFIVDNSLRVVNMTLSNYYADVYKINIQIKDNNKLSTKYGPAMFATYVFTTNPDGTKRFLKLWDPNSNKTSDIAVDTSWFGLRNAKGADLSKYVKWSTSSNGKVQNITFYVAGASGGDSIYYGTCAYDVAGNIKCTTDDICGFNPPSGLGNNWMKTSLDNVYSKGGFTQLPDYHELLNTIEWPIKSVKNLFTRYLQPFVANRAIIGNFAMVLQSLNGYGDIVWGYNKHFFDINNPYFGFDRRQIIVDSSRYYDMKNTALTRCSTLDSCTKITISTRDKDVARQQLIDAVSKNNSEYKVVILSKTDVVTPSILTCKNKNLIFIEEGTFRVSNQIIKNSFNPNSSSSNPFDIYDEGCLFVVSPDDTSRFIIDDDPKKVSKIYGKNLKGNGIDSVDADFSQFAVIGFGNKSGQITVKQTPRDNYRTDGMYDALILHGFIYSKALPIFERDLVFSANEIFPSEWIIYDASLIRAFNPLLGKYKIQTFKCGVNNHPWCNIPSSK